jgi:hypothetical protein
MKTILFIVVLLLAAYLLMKFNFIAIDRNVFDFQISHILERGSIQNQREYRAILNAVEQRFEKDNKGYASDPLVEIMNSMLADYHVRADSART